MINYTSTLIWKCHVSSSTFDRGTLEMPNLSVLPWLKCRAKYTDKPLCSLMHSQWPSCFCKWDDSILRTPWTQLIHVLFTSQSSFSVTCSLWIIIQKHAITMRRQLHGRLPFSHDSGWFITWHISSFNSSSEGGHHTVIWCVFNMSRNMDLIEKEISSVLIIIFLDTMSYGLPNVQYRGRTTDFQQLLERMWLTMTDYSLSWLRLQFWRYPN